MQRPQDAAAPAVKWEPVAFDFTTGDLLERLDKCDARELGVSVSSSSASAGSVAPASTAAEPDSDSDSD